MCFIRNAVQMHWKNQQHPYYLILIPFFFFLGSCEFDELDLETDTFGIRHDLDLTDYENLGQNRGNYISGNDYPDFESVCALTYIRDGEPIDASGVLIAPQWVLTAGHNLVSGDESFPDPFETEMEIYFGDDFMNPSQTISVDEVILHPGWIPNQGEGREAAVDVALLKLSKPVTNVTPASYVSTTVTLLDQKIFVCGFGDYAEALDSDELYSQKHAFENVLDRYVTNMTLDYNYIGMDQYKGGIMGCDFDSPLEYANTLDEESVNSSNVEVEALGSGNSDENPLDLEGTTVPGDSGCPAFIRINGSWTVIGITSSGSTDSNYGDVAIFSLVTSHQDWINTIL